MARRANREPRPGGGAPPRRAGDAERLRALVQQLTRSFGLLSTSTTPCGQPVSPSYAHALMVLLERRRLADTTSQAELGALLGIDKSNVTRLCGRMEAAGHLVQKRAPEDGRSRLLDLTARGATLATRIEEASYATFRRVIVAIPKDERRSLFGSLTALNTAVASLHGVEDDEP